MIQREVVDEIIARNDIESVIGSYVSLKRAGSNLKGLCPFHSEKTPSFTVYPSDNSFFCYGCSVGGNVITFIKQIEHLDYPDAVEFLAKRVGITVMHDNEEKYFKNSGIDKARLLKMNTEAARFFHASLFKDDDAAKNALSYFTEKRKLSIATIKHFGLGYAPDSFDTLIKYMTAKGYTRDELVAGYLAGKSENGHYYDAFRNKVMFPIIDVSGNVIAFGGRVLDNSKPKYKNSSDTPVYKKSRNLFALNFAKNTGAESMILCEGYMDVIALHAAGFTNAIATLGTAITEEQARLLKRYTKKIVICYDADEAGQKATNKAMKLLSEAGLEVSVIKVPGAKDPDEYIGTYGKEKFAEVINASKSKFEYNMEAVLSRYDLNLPQDKIDATQELVKLVSAIYFSAEREVYIQNISKLLGIDPKSIKDDVDRLVRRQQREQKKQEGEKIKRETLGYGDRVNADAAKAPAIVKAEENILGLLLLYPEHRKRVFGEGLLTEADFFSELNKNVFIFLSECFKKDADFIDDVNSVFPPEACGRIMKMKLTRMELADNGPSVLKECIESLKNQMQKKSTENISTFDGLANLLSSLQVTKKDNNENK